MEIVELHWLKTFALATKGPFSPEMGNFSVS
jgi:hypothetical protein